MSNQYTDNPQASHTLAADQPKIESNFLYLTNTLGKDHQIAVGDLDTASFEGRHIQVSLNDRSNINLSMPGDGTDSLLWSSGGNVFFKNTTIAAGVPLTASNFVPIKQPIGSSFLPGGSVIQWGLFNTNSTSGTVIYASAFPNQTYTIFFGYTNTNQFVVANSIAAADRFTWVSKAAVNATAYYVAIGN